MTLDVKFYRKYLQEYVQEAIKNGNRTNSEISQYLWEKKISGILVRHRTEKQQALTDARKAFDEHQHWPLDIVISHLGIDPKEVLNYS